MDNYAYFGLHKGSGIRHIRDSITAINDVLLSTNRLKKDPLQGQPETLYYDQILRQLQQEQFHPATARQQRQHPHRSRRQLPQKPAAVSNNWDS